jgi:nicotinamidase-related amidase
MTTTPMSFADKAYSYDHAGLGLIVVDLTRHAERGGAFDQVLRRRGADPTYFFERIEQSVVPNTIALVERFRRIGRPVVFTKVLIEEDDASDWPRAYRRDVLALKLAPSRPGMESYELLSPLSAHDTDLVFGKRSVSAFCGGGLGDTLRSLGVVHVVLTGCTTNFGVGVTAVDAANQGFEVTLVDDACAALSAGAHDQWLAMHELFLQRATTEQVLAALGA